MSSLTFVVQPPLQFKFDFFCCSEHFLNWFVVGSHPSLQQVEFSTVGASSISASKSAFVLFDPVNVKISDNVRAWHLSVC